MKEWKGRCWVLKYRDELLLGVICLLGYTIIWFKSLAVIAFIDAALFGARLTAMQIIYMATGGMILMIMIQIGFLLKIHRATIHRD